MLCPSLSLPLVLSFLSFLLCLSLDSLSTLSIFEDFLNDILARETEIHSLIKAFNIVQWLKWIFCF